MPSKVRWKTWLMNKRNLLIKRDRKMIVMNTTQTIQKMAETSLCLHQLLTLVLTLLTCSLVTNKMSWYSKPWKDIWSPNSLYQTHVPLLQLHSMFTLHPQFPLELCQAVVSSQFHSNKSLRLFGKLETCLIRIDLRTPCSSSKLCLSAQSQRLMKWPKTSKRYSTPTMWTSSSPHIISHAQ